MKVPTGPEDPSKVMPTAVPFARLIELMNRTVIPKEQMVLLRRCMYLVCHAFLSPRLVRVLRCSCPWSVKSGCYQKLPAVFLSALLSPACLHTLLVSYGK